MKQYSIIFFWGMFISFLGTLPPGALNITATQITAQQGQGAAVVFAVASMLTEVIIVRLALTSMKRIIARKRLFQILELLTAALLLAMTVGCFIAATKYKSDDFQPLIFKTEDYGVTWKKITKN